MLETITKKTHPKEWAIVLKALPSYRKRKAFLSRTESVELYGRYWDEGSKNEWVVIIGNIAKPVAGRMDFPFTAPEKVVELNKNTSVVCAGYFCGKPSTAHLYIALT